MTSGFSLFTIFSYDDLSILLTNWRVIFYFRANNFIFIHSLAIVTQNGLAHIIYRSIIVALILFYCLAITLLMAAFAHLQ